MKSKIPQNKQVIEVREGTLGDYRMSPLVPLL